LTGGCLISTGDAANTSYETSISKPSKATRKKSMFNRRYAHASVSLNGYIYVMGGFDNRDANEIAPSTLDLCERYNFHDNKWSSICTLNEARAFCGSCSIGEQFIYLFGGFRDYEVLNSIEKYDSVLDNCHTLFVKLTMPLARLGVAALDG
jgi:N-acetylneuraminic acid mutarotase